MQQWWWALVALAVLGAGYVLRRWIERRRRMEGLSRKLRALALYQGMKREGVSLDDLDRIEREAGR